MRLRNLKQAGILEDEVRNCGGTLPGDKIRLVQRNGSKFKREVLWFEPLPMDPSNGLIECYLALDVTNRYELGCISIYVKHCGNTGRHYGMPHFYLKRDDEPAEGWVAYFESLIELAKLGGYRKLGIPEDFSRCLDKWEDETWATFMTAFENHKHQGK